MKGNYYTLHNILLYKNNKTIWMFYGEFADDEDNPVNNTKIYNVEGNKKLSPGLHLLTTGSVLKIRFYSVRFRICILFTGNYFVVFCKTKHSSHKQLRVVSV